MSQTIEVRTPGRKPIRVARGERELDAWRDRVVQAMESPSLVTCWLSTIDGELSEVEVTTPRNPGESVQDWHARHQAAVEAFQETYPYEGSCN